MNQHTPLYQTHLDCGARMVDFHGWDMPLHYGSQIEEHHATRTQAGLFDVSHMTIVDILGAGGRQFLRHLLTNDVDTLTHTGRSLYSCMCNPHGGIIDDLIVNLRASDNYRVIFNSATRDRVLPWVREKSQGFSVGLQERSDLAMIALQGPKAKDVAEATFSPSETDAMSTLRAFECVDVGEHFFARTGYTGEDGFEIVVPKAEVSTLWTQLVVNGAKPCGLAARDTLRLEAGLMLYGQDMDETTTPLESALGWTVKWEPEDRDFIGMGALISQRLQGVSRRMVGLILEEPGIMRHGQRVVISGQKDGVITSGGYSPTLEKSIAFARIPAGDATSVLVDIRGKLLNARVTKPRFVKLGQSIVL